MSDVALVGGTLVGLLFLAWALLCPEEVDDVVSWFLYHLLRWRVHRAARRRTREERDARLGAVDDELRGMGL